MKTLFAEYCFRIFFLFIAFFSITPIDGLHAQNDKQAELTAFSGTVEVLLKDAPEYIPAEEGMILEAGDKIKTAIAANAELSFNTENINLVRLSESTSAELTFSSDVKLSLTEGEVLASISQLSSGSYFEIRTPTAISGARGTDWVTKITPDGTDVEAINDQPYIRHFESSGIISKQITPITPGQMTTVRKFQKPEVFRPISEFRRQQWQIVKQNIRKNAAEAVIKRQQRPLFDRKNFLQQNKKDPSAAINKPIANTLKINPATEQKEGRSVFKPLETDEQTPPEAFKPLISREKNEYKTSKQNISDTKPTADNRHEKPGIESKSLSAKPANEIDNEQLFRQLEEKIHANANKQKNKQAE